MFPVNRVHELICNILARPSEAEASLTELKALADAGDSGALHGLGILYAGRALGHASSTLEDFPRAVACFESSTLPESKINLGVMLSYGLGTAQDRERAKRLFVEVIRRHRNCAAPAMFNIALMYRDGDSRPANRRRYGKWLLLAAVHGSPKARALLQKDFRVIVLDDIMVMGLPAGSLN